MFTYCMVSYHAVLHVYLVTRYALHRYSNTVVHLLAGGLRLRATRFIDSDSSIGLKLGEYPLSGTRNPLVKTA